MLDHAVRRRLVKSNTQQVSFSYVLQRKLILCYIRQSLIAQTNKFGLTFNQGKKRAKTSLWTKFGLQDSPTSKCSMWHIMSRENSHWRWSQSWWLMLNWRKIRPSIFPVHINIPLLMMILLGFSLGSFNTLFMSFSIYANLDRMIFLVKVMFSTKISLFQEKEELSYVMLTIYGMFVQTLVESCKYSPISESG
jgi:hypothetical protein